MSKQDRQGARNISEFERRHNYGERFNEVMGVASEARRMAEEAQDDLDGLTQEQIFNILTNDGNAQGLFRTEDGQVYINASYIAGGVLQSADGKVKIFLNGGAPVFNTGVSTNGLQIRADEIGADRLFEVGTYDYGDGLGHHFMARGFSTYGSEIFRVEDRQGHTAGAMEITSPDGTSSIRLTAENTGSAMIQVFSYNNVPLTVMSVGGNAYLNLYAINPTQIHGKTVSWKDNGDGTYTLIGT